MEQSKELVQKAWMNALAHKQEAREQFEQWLRSHGINKSVVAV